METMKTFRDLNFKPHKGGNGWQAKMDFPNGYGVSVVNGPMFYSDGPDSYELAVIADNECCYTTPVTGDVLGHLCQVEVSEAMVKVQKLEPKGCAAEA